MPTLRRYPQTVAGGNSAGLPLATIAPPVTVKALYLPRSYDQSARKWSDLSGNGVHLTAAAGKEPTTIVEGAATLVHFDGTKLLTAALSLPQPFTFVALARINAVPATGRGIIGAFKDAPALWAGSIFASGAFTSRFDLVDGSASPAAPGNVGTMNTHGTTFNGPASKVYRDATVVTVPTVTTTQAAATFVVGSSNAGLTAPSLIADIAAMAIVDRALTDTEYANLRAYLLRSTSLG